MFFINHFSECGECSIRRNLWGARTHCSGSSKRRWFIGLGSGAKWERQPCLENCARPKSWHWAMWCRCVALTWTNTSGLASRLAIRSVGVVSLLLRGWKTTTNPLLNYYWTLLTVTAGFSLTSMILNLVLRHCIIYSSNYWTKTN